MIVNKVELEDLDICDLEVAEKYDKAVKGFYEIEKEAKKLGGIEGIRMLCNSVFNLFNTMFGDGTDKKVFGDRVNIRICMEALEEFMLQVNGQVEEFAKFTNKYSPNRVKKGVKKK